MVATAFLMHAERDAVHRALSDKLARLGDVHVTLGACDELTARRLLREYRDCLRLLDDLGWAQHDPRPVFRVTMSATSLVRLLSQLPHAASGIAEVRARLIVQLEGRGEAST